MDIRSGEPVSSMFISFFAFYLFLFVSFVGFLDIVYCQLDIMIGKEKLLLVM